MARSIPSSYVDSYTVHDPNFGDIRYVCSSHVSPVTEEPDYVPDFVSSIVPGSEYLLKTLPLVLRRMTYTQRNEKENEPQVLTTDGPVPLSAYTLRLTSRHHPPTPTLKLAPHSLVPRTESGRVDVDGLLKMNRRIATREADTRVAPRCCRFPCPQADDEDVNVSELLRYQSSGTSFMGMS